MRPELLLEIGRAAGGGFRLFVRSFVHSFIRSSMHLQQIATESLLSTTVGKKTRPSPILPRRSWPPEG